MRNAVLNEMSQSDSMTELLKTVKELNKEINELCNINRTLTGKIRELERKLAEINEISRN